MTLYRCLQMPNSWRNEFGELVKLGVDKVYRVCYNVGEDRKGHLDKRIGQSGAEARAAEGFLQRAGEQIRVTPKGKRPDRPDTQKLK